MTPSRRDARRISTLRSAARVYVRFGSTTVLLSALLIVLIVRVRLGGAAGPADGAVIVLVALVAPFVEWVVHREVLHRRPYRLGSRVIDLAGGHVRHHRNPTDLASIPLRASYTAGYVVLVGALLAAVGWLYGIVFGSGFPSSGVATSGAAAAVAMLRYEWLHLVMHTSYRPRLRRTRVLMRNHRLHHFRNEGFWLGVTSNLGDRVAGTLPINAAAVLTSDTARTLGVDI